MFGNKKKLETQLQAQGGIVAWATVTEAHTKWASGRADGFNRITNETDHVRVSVRVEPDGQEPFEATFSQAFKGRVPMREWQCKVIYDPADHSRMAVLEDSITPPGIDHDKAERAAARRAEAIEAARSGHMAEYIEKRKAEARSGALPGFVMVDGQVVSGADSPVGKALAAAGALPGPAAPETKTDVADQLTKLAELRDRGILTPEEFQSQKQKLLASS